MVIKVDYEKEEIFLSDFIIDKKMVVHGSKEVLEMNGKAFNYGLNRNLFVLVEYDEALGIILE